MALLKEIYVHLQGKSGHYPFLDHHTVREHFLKKADLPCEPLDLATYDTILS